MEHEDSIIISCLNCRMSFFLEALTGDYNGDVPNPTYCPFCASHELEEGFLLDDLSDEDAEMFREELETLEQRSKPRPKLTLLPGGRAGGGQDGKRNEEDRNPNYGSAEQSQRIRQDDRPRHPYER